MPVMHIITGAASRPQSAPPGPRNGQVRGTKSRESHSNARTPQRSPERVPSIAPRATAASTLALGPKPELDRSRVDAELALTPGMLIHNESNTYLVSIWFRPSIPPPTSDPSSAL